MHWVRGVHATISARWPDLAAELLPSATLRVELRRLDFDRTAREHLGDLGLCRAEHRFPGFVEPPAVPWSPATGPREPRAHTTSAAPADRHAAGVGPEPPSSGAASPTTGSKWSATGIERPNPGERSAEPDDVGYGRHSAPGPATSPTREAPASPTSDNSGPSGPTPSADPGSGPPQSGRDTSTGTGTGEGRRRRSRSLSELSFAELLAGALDAYREGRPSTGTADAGS
jgi:hypothetical protein